MLHWALTFFLIAIVAALFGFGAVSGTALEIAKVLCLVFLVLSIVVFVFGRRRRS